MGTYKTALFVLAERMAFHDLMGGCFMTVQISECLVMQIYLFLNFEYSVCSGS